MKISDYTHPKAGHWKVNVVGWPDKPGTPTPDDVHVDEQLCFVLHGDIIVAKVTSQRFGDHDLSKAAPSWDGLAFRIHGSNSRNDVTLRSTRLIWDEEMKMSDWHILTVNPDGINTGIFCEYYPALYVGAESGVMPAPRMAAAAGGHSGTWHAPH